MASETSGKHAWVPIIVAIITSFAAVMAAWVTANSKSEYRLLEAKLAQSESSWEKDRKELEALLGEAKNALTACQGELRLAQQAQPGLRNPNSGDVVGRQLPVDTSERPVEVATVRVRLKIRPGYDQAAVYLDGTLKPIAKRSLYWLELDAPKKAEPTFVRVEAKGRPTCEKLVHLQPSDDGIAIC